LSKGYLIDSKVTLWSYELVDTLICQPYIEKSKSNEKLMFDDISEGLVKSRRILFTLKGYNKDNVTNTKQV